VYVVRGDHVQATAVTLGEDEGTTTKILSGLGPDDCVVLNPRSGLEERTAVVANLVATGNEPHCGGARSISTSPATR
jgi:hypothetical protein